MLTDPPLKWCGCVRVGVGGVVLYDMGVKLRIFFIVIIITGTIP